MFNRYGYLAYCTGCLVLILMVGFICNMFLPSKIVGIIVVGLLGIFLVRMMLLIE